MAEGVADLRTYLEGKGWNVGVRNGKTLKLPAVYVTFGSPSFAAGRVARTSSVVVELLADWAGGKDPDKDVEEASLRLADDLWENNRWYNFAPLDARSLRTFLAT